MAFGRRMKFLFIRRTFIEEFERHKRRLWKWASLSIGAPVGETGGGSFTGTFERDGGL